MQLMEFLIKIRKKPLVGLCWGSGCPTLGLGPIFAYDFP